MLERNTNNTKKVYKLVLSDPDSSCSAKEKSTTTEDLFASGFDQLDFWCTAGRVALQVIPTQLGNEPLTNHSGGMESRITGGIASGLILATGIAGYILNQYDKLQRQRSNDLQYLFKPYKDQYDALVNRKGVTSAEIKEWLDKQQAYLDRAAEGLGVKLYLGHDDRYNLTIYVEDNRKPQVEEQNKAFYNEEKQTPWTKIKYALIFLGTEIWTLCVNAALTYWPLWFFGALIFGTIASGIGSFGLTLGLGFIFPVCYALTEKAERYAQYLKNIRCYSLLNPKFFESKGFKANTFLSIIKNFIWKPVFAPFVFIFCLIYHALRKLYHALRKLISPITTNGYQKLLDEEENLSTAQNSRIQLQNIVKTAARKFIILNHNNKSECHDQEGKFESKNEIKRLDKRLGHTSHFSHVLSYGITTTITQIVYKLFIPWFIVDTITLFGGSIPTASIFLEITLSHLIGVFLIGWAIWVAYTKVREFNEKLSERHDAIAEIKKLYNGIMNHNARYENNSINQKKIKELFEHNKTQNDIKEYLKGISDPKSKDKLFKVIYYGRILNKLESNENQGKKNNHTLDYLDSGIFEDITRTENGRSYRTIFLQRIQPVLIAFTSGALVFRLLAIEGTANGLLPYTPPLAANAAAALPSGSLIIVALVFCALLFAFITHLKINYDRRLEEAELFMQQIDQRDFALGEQLGLSSASTYKQAVPEKLVSDETAGLAGGHLSNIGTTTAKGEGELAQAASAHGHFAPQPNKAEGADAGAGADHSTKIKPDIPEERSTRVAFTG